MEKLDDVEEILYDLAESIEKHSEYLFIIHTRTHDGLIPIDVIDVLDYENQFNVDGGNFTPSEAIKFMRGYKELYD